MRIFPGKSSGSKRSNLWGWFILQCVFYESWFIRADEILRDADFIYRIELKRSGVRFVWLIDFLFYEVLISWKFMWSWSKVSSISRGTWSSESLTPLLITRKASVVATSSSAWHSYKSHRSSGVEFCCNIIVLLSSNTWEIIGWIVISRYTNLAQYSLSWSSASRAWILHIYTSTVLCTSIIYIFRTWLSVRTDISILNYEFMSSEGLGCLCCLKSMNLTYVRVRPDKRHNIDLIVKWFDRWRARDYVDDYVRDHWISTVA